MDIEGSWIPATPVKPGGASPQPICTDKQPSEDNCLGSEQGIQIGQASWEELSRFSTGFQQENETQRTDVWCGSTNGIDRSQGFDLWDEEMGFTDLLELANIATITSDPANGVKPVEANTDCALGSAQYGCSIPSRLSFDLNSLPKTTAEAVLDNISKFVPVTPDQSKKQASEVHYLNVEERMNRVRNEQDDEVANKRVEVIEINDDDTEDSQQDQSCTQFQENHNADTGSNEGTDLNKTPQQQKPRRRKHRPKVIREGGKPARPRKPNAPKTVGPKELGPTGKRKYVRKKGIEKPQATPSEQVNAGPNEPKIVEGTEKSCRRSLNFDNIESQVRDESSSYRSPLNFDTESHAQNFSAGVQSTVQIGPGLEVRVETTQVGIAYDLTRLTSNLVPSYISMPDRQAPNEEKLDSQNASTSGKCRIVFSDETHDKETSSVHTMTNIDGRTAPSPNDSTCSSSVCLNNGEQARGLKRVNSSTPREVVNAFGSHYNSLQAFGATFPVNGCRLPGMHFPAIHKKKRTEKVYGSATSSTSTMTAVQNLVRPTTVGASSSEISRYSSAQFNAMNAPMKAAAASVSEDKQHAFQCMLALGQVDNLKKKRTKGPTRVRDYASLIGMVPMVTPPAGLATTSRPHTCMEALAADTRARLARKKRTKRNSFVNSMSLSIYNHGQHITKPRGRPPSIKWRAMYSIEALIEQFGQLNINADQYQSALVPYNMRYKKRYHYHEQNALVLYQRDGMLVPFEGAFNPMKKRKPRPKVNLDDETTRVWKLLLQDINSVGIDGTDEEKARWWEEERRVFRGRADSFIARMHLVQGDRRFSKWKGSVVDSVVGVFLTQNVSDHLSSSAFMSLAARYPLKSKRGHDRSDEEDTTRLVREPEVIEPDDTIEWREDKPNQPASDQSSMTIQVVEYNEEKEIINCNESFGSSTDGDRSKDNLDCKLVDFSTKGKETMVGDQREQDDVISSQNSVVSSQNSVDSLIAQTVERTGSCSQSNSETEPVATSKPNDSGGPTSFLELLRMAHRVFNQDSGNEPSSWKNPLESREPDPQEQGRGPTSDCHLHLNPNSVEVESFDALREESRFSGSHKKNEENCASEQSGVSAESATQAAREAPKSSDENNHSCQLLTEMNKTLQSQRIAEDPKGSVPNQAVENPKSQRDPRVPNFSGETFDATESTSIVDNSKSETMVVQSNLSSSKAKSGRVAKEKQSVVDWDILRKEAQEAHGVREGEPNTMDSVDWETIRCADVNEVAYTIRERGMNNMLAERIKDFLNRLVRDHGSIDLEWLRDVPPDKAKEYLLSIRGLGLKSVECVRLLTLHHLAFPVDTNVGRIAVRLGWVPLQPLPESLQLHLLELYPILESIQKYLWPRLCKLDQRTLYELHYQMITFGKVFCTKSKPNCNACPMRGECRHFASAFASARLALPAPEEKSIVPATENIGAANQPEMGPINRLQLPPPQPNQQLVQSEVSNNCAPIIEEPASPEPIIEVPPSPEPEQTEITEFDIEDTCEDPEEIPTIKLNIEEFTQNLQNYMQQNMELQEGDVSKALVALTSEAASIPTPKLKNVSRLRTEHQVYELPDSHPLLEGLDKREPDDPCSYLLAIWTPGETPDSIQPPEGGCNPQESGRLCDEKTCFSCNNIRESNSQTVRGTLLIPPYAGPEIKDYENNGIPCRTAMRGSFPLNGTYFQVNEVFADHDSSLNPIDVPRAWIWNLPRRTVYFGTSIPTIFKGLTTEGIQFCFWRGFVCVRGFDQKTRAPRPLMARLHFPASKMVKTKGKPNED